MDFSVIVPVRNRADQIAACVASLYRSEYPPALFEVLVVDDGSRDETAQAAASAGARVLSSPGPNRCRARNVGAEAARGRWLAFTDSDCEAEPTWLKELAKEERRLAGLPEGERIGALAGAIVPGEPRSAVEAYIAKRRWIDQEKFLSEGRRFSPPFAATANLAIRADVFERVGGFDPDLSTAGEDADWCWRARAAGWEIGFAPEARVIHHHRATRRDLLRQAHNYGLGNADLFAKYRGEWGVTAWIELRHYLWAVKGLVKSPFTALMGRKEIEKKLPWYDFLANSAQASGRLRGAWKHKIAIL